MNCVNMPASGKGDQRSPSLQCYVARENQVDDMQDRHLVAQIELPDKGNIDLVAIFDGYGGPEVAEELLKILPEILANKFDHVRDIHNPLSMTDAIREAILAIDYKMYQGGGLPSQSTATIALWPHHDHHLYIANLGNSKAIVSTNNEVILETKMHTPDNEARRLKAAGGTVTGPVSRSFGGFEDGLKLRGPRYLGKNAPLSADPDVYWLDMRGYPDEIKIVLATDGLWNVMTTPQVVQFFNSSNDCEKLVAKAIKRKSRDNITVMLLVVPASKVQN